MTTVLGGAAVETKLLVLCKDDEGTAPLLYGFVKGAGSLIASLKDFQHLFPFTSTLELPSISSS